MRPSNPIRCGGFPELLAKVEARDKMSLSTRSISKLDESTNPLIPVIQQEEAAAGKSTKYHRFDPLQFVDSPGAGRFQRHGDEVSPI